MGLQIENDQKILFTGDSITDCGCRDPQWRPLGNGYVNIFNDFVKVREPTKQIEVINTGIGGHTNADLRDRWMDDVLAYAPDWLSIKIGINDCNRYLGDANGSPSQSPEGFEAIYDQLLKLTKAELPDIRLLLIDPFYCSLDNGGKETNSHRARMYDALPGYIAAVDRMGEKYGALRVKTHDLFQAQFKHQAPSVYFPFEPVHPNATGHMLIAEAVWDALQA